MARARAEDRARLMLLVSADSEALHALSYNERDQFCSRLRELAAASGSKCSLAGDQGFRLFLSWCRSVPAVPVVVSRAVEQRHKGVQAQRKHKREFIEKLGLDWKNVDRDAYLQMIPIKTVSALAAPYPPMRECIAESSSIFHKWYDHFATGPQADSRKRRLPVHRLDHSKLVYDVLPKESVIFRNRRGRLVAAVLRNFCPDEATVAWADSVVADAMPGRRNIRMEDPGKLVQMGYSAGARSKPSFHWVRNLLSKAGGPAAAAESDRKASCVYALAWQLLRGHLPEEVIRDFDDFMEKTKLKRMDGNGQLSPGILNCTQSPGGAGSYSVNANGHEFSFHHVELAPPAGVFGENYARAPHTEKQPHKYGVSWTLTRTGGVEWGGHFYLAKYGIRVQGAPNTVIVWIPQEAHGTSLQDVHPDDCSPPFCQRGLAFVTSNRLPGVWEKYLAGQMSMKDVEGALMGEDTE
ncbi:hypothetical protein LshimejAT787_0702130 [Lyophyllum shimeji]|uniref:Uncharacterized protein n=1 Tax=Lyophyllum shimeji TaxID=47721 RepID=A0A9P3PPJ1_LYOSH|nr:hypothetical protein LshimejAT787_0702130 [Lyophyllum shimeji]